MKENLRRWSGNMLRNGYRAIMLGPRAMPFFIQAIKKSPPTDPFPMHISQQLHEKGRADLAEKIMNIETARDSQLNAPDARRE